MGVAKRSIYCVLRHEPDWMIMLKPGSSPVDWCESNYSNSPFIAEYVNTVRSSKTFMKVLNTLRSHYNIFIFF